MATKENILKAATHLFATKGFDATSVKDICDLSGSNISAVNYHFETKQKLFSAIVESCVELMNKDNRTFLTNDIESKEEFIFALKIFYKNLFDLAKDNWEMMAVFFNNAGYQKVTAELNIDGQSQSVIDKYTKFLEMAQTKGYIAESLDIKMLAEITHGAIKWQIYYKFLTPNSEIDIFDESYQKKFINNLLQMLK